MSAKPTKQKVGQWGGKRIGAGRRADPLSSLLSVEARGAVRPEFLERLRTLIEFDEALSPESVLAAVLEVGILRREESNRLRARFRSEGSGFSLARDDQPEELQNP